MILLLCTVGAFAQKSGAIYYTETMKIEFHGGEVSENIASMMPSSRDMFKVLYYDQNESLFKNVLNKSDDLEFNQNGNEIQLVIKVPEIAIYTNSKKNEAIQFQEFLGKDFLISDKLDSRKWKLDPEQKKVLDFTCQKAILQDSEEGVIAWYTSQIPMSIGPNAYSGLPGLVLAVEIGDGQRMITATKIEPLPSGFEFTKPNKGQKVGRKEFAKIREEKMSEMGAVRGRGGKMMMIIEEVNE